MGHVIEHIALEVQTLAGMDTVVLEEPGLQMEKDPGVYYVSVQITMEEDAGVYAAKSISEDRAGAGGWNGL